MPEFENVLVTGGGIAGIAAAYWASGINPAETVYLLERSGSLLAGWPASLKGPMPIATREAFTGHSVARGAEAAERMLQAWPGSATCDWLGSLGLPLAEDADGLCRVVDLEGFREAFARVLESRGVGIVRDYSVETVSPQPGGGFRVWSREGRAMDGKCLLLATGGERNHGIKLASQLGADVNPILPAYIRLRLSSDKLGEQLGPLEGEVSLRCERTGEQASGQLSLSSRGLEGPALSSLSGRVGPVWQQAGWRVRLQVDWLPGLSGASVRGALQTRSEGGGRRSIGDTPLFGFSGKQWNAFLQLSRIDPETPWPRLKARKLNGLIQRLKASPINCQGMGLPSGERAWAGGVDPLCLNANGQSLRLPGLYFAGEILDILGSPGGAHYNLMWASAHLAGSSMGSFNA